MSSAHSITAAVNPPRAVYLDYPLGRTSGKANDAANQRAIMRETFAAFETIDTPGTLVPLRHEWSHDHSWKDGVMRPASQGAAHQDARVERHATPQYQSPEDEAAVEPDCPTCVFLAET